MDKHCSTPDSKFTKIREKSPLELSQIQESPSPSSFDADIESRGASFVSTPISTRCITYSQKKNCRACIQTYSTEKTKKTPKYSTRTPVSSSRKKDHEECASQDVLSNPFEPYLLERLHTHTCSPSIFAKVVSPSDEVSSDGKFWSIDHIALINPADIDISSFNQSASMKTDCEMESRIQATVDQYFAESVIAPSPWCESMTSVRRKPRETSSLPNSPSSGVYTQNSSVCVHADTQTMLTFAPDVDLAAILGDRFVYQEENPKCNDLPYTSETPSTTGNSLRRKLFVSATKNIVKNRGRSPRRALQL